jgi:hypothetical protein
LLPLLYSGLPYSSTIKVKFSRKCLDYLELYSVKSHSRRHESLKSNSSLFHLFLCRHSGFSLEYLLRLLVHFCN